MGVIRDIFLLQAILGSSKKELASRNAEGEPICGGCRSVVPENATACANCTADLYTKRGRIGRRGVGLFGFSFTMMALLPPGSGPGLGLVGSVVAAR